MKQKSIMDFTPFLATLAAGVAILAVASLLTSNFPGLSLSRYLEVPRQRSLALGFFLGGSVMGLVALDRIVARLRRPWVVPQSQAVIAYALFFVAFVIAIVLSH